MNHQPQHPPTSNSSTGFTVKPLSKALCLSMTLGALLAPTSSLLAATAPELVLANHYQSGVELSNYWVSEKYDGVRAYWNGKQLLTRSGNPINAPHWFTAPLPAYPLDGELWLRRGAFAQVSAIVRSAAAPDKEWRQVKFMLFDLPQHRGNFEQRLGQLTTLVSTLEQPHIQLAQQQSVASEQALFQLLEQVVDAEGEGLMLRLNHASYRSGRSDDLLKLKKYQDAEAKVIGYQPGKGKYTGMMGALLVELSNGRQFKIGTGFSDQERRQPPPLGSIITFKYYGTTKTGLPRFASFLRIRQDMPALNQPL